jgi:hypothetical protein
LRKTFDLKERHAESVAFREEIISGAVHIGRPETKSKAAALDGIDKLAVEASAIPTSIERANPSVCGLETGQTMRLLKGLTNEVRGEDLIL